MAQFWVSYKRGDRFVSAVIVHNLQFCGIVASTAAIREAGLACDIILINRESDKQIPPDMVERVLTEAEVRQLMSLVTPKKPPAPSVRRASTARRVRA